MVVRGVMPKRIQLRRTKGWRKPEEAIVVARPTKWGNPFPMDGPWMMWVAIAIGCRADRAGRRRAAVALHSAWLCGRAVGIRDFDPIAAHETNGGYLEFEDGSSVSLADHAAGIAVFAASIYTPPTLPERPTDFTELRGHDLACWCPLEDDQGRRVPCHADALLELANPGWTP